MSQKAAKKDTPKWQKWVIRSLWLFGLVLPLLSIVVLVWSRMDTVPSFKELENPPEKQASIVLDRSGKELGRYWKINRKSVRYDQLSPHMVSALISTEDERYRSHAGIDMEGLGRAVVKGAMGQNAGGASTVTQQLAKMIYSKHASNKIERLLDKVTENITAVKLESRYSKDEIIAMYFNRYDWLNNAVGIQSAAKVYFNKTPSELNEMESAMLIGMLKNSALYNPMRRDSMVRHRRTVVLNQWRKNTNKGTILPSLMPDSLYEQLKYDSIALGLNYQRADHKEGIAQHFRETLRQQIQKELNKKDAKGNYIHTDGEGNPYNVYTDGLRIYTTLDVDMQKYAEESMHKWLSVMLQGKFNEFAKRSLKNPPFDNKTSQEQIDRSLWGAAKYTYRWEHAKTSGKSTEEIKEEFKKPVEMQVYTYHRGYVDTVLTPIDSIRYYKYFLQSGMMSVDPQTGLVKAYVGGPNFTLNSLDHVQTKRQVGSTIKPFFYAAAMNFGIVDPWTEFTNMEYCVPIPEQPTWCPQTGAPDQDKYPTLQVKKALALSANNITVAIMNRFGTPRGPEVFKKLLVDVGFDSTQVEATPAMVLGPMTASVYQMTGAHAALANLGVYIKPRYLLRVEDRNGNLIYDTDVDVRRVMSKEEAYRIIEVMKGVINGGTASRLRSPNYNYGKIPYDIPMAGKTGTTNNASDGWFIGSTPRLVTGVWVGADDMQVHFPNLQWGQGGRMAMPIYGYYMNHLYSDSKLNLFKGDWEKPAGIIGDPLMPGVEEEDNTNTPQDSWDRGF